MLLRSRSGRSGNRISVKWTSQKSSAVFHPKACVLSSVLWLDFILCIPISWLAHSMESPACLTTPAFVS